MSLGRLEGERDSGPAILEELGSKGELQIMGSR